MVKPMMATGSGILRRAVSLLVFAAAGLSAAAQLSVTNGVAPTTAVQSVLLGDGVTASNITFNGTLQQIGTFNCSNCNLGLSSGVVIGSGNVQGAMGPNNSGSYTLGPSSGWGQSDPDLQMISGFSLNDRAALTFDFVPTGDSVVFRFVFSSEEYPEYSGSSFNDAFGFFLSGPGISGPFSNNARNLALIPGTQTSIAINNLNNGTSGVFGPCNNCTYYNHNGTGGTAPMNSNNYYIQADGFTTVLTARALVQCGQTYRIKLAIADAGDTSFDSWVFLEAGSFQSNQLSVAYTGPQISPGANSVYEGCQPGQLVFTRPAGLNTQDVYTVMTSGTATSGDDYTPLPTQIVFPPLVSSVTIPVEALADNITEGTETLILNLSGGTSCIPSSLTYTVNLVDLPPLNVSLGDVEINCGESVTLSPQISGGIGYYSVIWASAVNALDYTVSPAQETTYNYMVYDTCGVTPWPGSVTVSFPDYPPLQVDVGGDQIITCLDPLSITPAVSGGFAPYAYNWTSGGTSLSQAEVLQLDNVSAGLITLTVSDQCGETDSDAANISFTPLPVTVDLGPDLSVTCLDVTTLTASVSGGVGTYSYVWTQAGGISLGNNPTASVQTSGNTTVSLLVTDQCGNQGGDNMIVQVPAVAVQADPGPDIVATCIETVELNAGGNGGVGTYSYTWLNGGDVYAQGPVAYYQGFGETLTLQITDQCGNSGTADVTISVPPVPLTVNAGPDVQATCVDQVPLQATGNGGVGAYSFAWYEGTTQISSTANATFQGATATALTVNIADQCGNTGSDQLMITYPPVPVLPDAGSDVIATCLDDVALLASATGGVGNAYTYSWTHNGAVFSQTADATFQTDQQVTLTVSATDACGNTGSDQVIISVPPVPVTVDAGQDITATCLDAVPLEAIASGGVGSAFLYVWTDGGDILSQQSTASVVVGTNTVLTVTATDACGNTGTDDVLISIPAVPLTVDGGPDITATCLDNLSLQAQASGGVGSDYTYVWIANGGAISQQSTASYQTDENIVLTVVAEDICGNTASDQVSIILPPAPVNVDAGADQSTTCLQPVTLNSAASGGIGSLSYSWATPYSIVGAGPSATFQPSQTVQVTLTVTDQCGNSGNDVVLVQVPPVPVSLSVSPDQIFCQGTSVTVSASASGGVGALSYEWLHNGSAYPTIAVAPAATTSYTVTAEDQCGNTASASTTVGVDIVQAGFTGQYTGHYGVELTNHSLNGATYTWYFPDGTTSNEEHPTHTFTTMDPWVITLEVTGPLGCVSTHTQTFHPEANLYIPNSFTPDNDFINDAFVIKGHDIEWFKVRIFNRWGEQVYYSESLDEAWDGSHQDGAYFVPDGVYVYQLQAQGVRGNVIEKTGSVLLIR
jgi:gliding motility-associated-like protein